ncbi:MAG: alpha/beta fold hydrolase [Alphaproteobacteria bacterium]|nr:alpha/beta fold hydrolase [Alphaproteobacteria bacterium]
MVATFVLIHGSYQGGWIWKPVAARLRRDGHLVFAPSLDGCGERAAQQRPGITTETQAGEVAGFLWAEDLRDVILVGASSGGMVMAKTAELARERVARLVFLDALALRHGECIRDIVAGSMRVRTEYASGPTRDERLQRFLLDMDPDLAEWAADRSTLHPIGVSTEPWNWRSSGPRRGTCRWSSAAGPESRGRPTSAAPPRRSAPAGTSSTPATTRC